jgi:hypothetical protein
VRDVGRAKWHIGYFPRGHGGLAYHPVRVGEPHATEGIFGLLIQVQPENAEGNLFDPTAAEQLFEPK